MSNCTFRIECLLFAVLIAMTAIACGGGGGGGDSGPSTFAIEPDPVHTGNDCGCGGKNSTGSGMTFSSTRPLFPCINNKKYVPGEVLVKFREGTSQSRSGKIMNSVGSDGVKSLFTHRKGAASLLKKVKLKEGKSVESAIREYSAYPEVEYAEPNFIYRANAIPIDASYGQLWGLNNTGQQVNGVTGTMGKDIGAETAWNELTDCSGVIVAVLDTGINYNHRDLASNMWDGGATYPGHGYDFVDDDNDPMDLNGHGTHCSGTIGANGNDGVGLAGVCWKVKLMAVRVLDASGSGTLADIAEGIEFAVARGAHIISASLGGPHSVTMQNAVNTAETSGVIIVAAAGNDGTLSTTYAYPAAYTNDNIISVAAVDQNGDLADFSNFGTTWVDIAAPGVNILSTWPGQTVVTEDSFIGWTMERGWGRGTYTDLIPDLPIVMLTNPPVFNNQYVYANNLNSMAYRSFELGAYGAGSAVASFLALIDVEEDFDYFRFVVGTTGSRPTFELDNFTGYMVYYLSYDLTDFMDDTVNLGFQMESDFSISYQGAGIAWFDIMRLYPNTSACLYSAGTSMAAPHVTGVVAMCVQKYRNMNGSYSRGDNYASIIQSVLNGAVNDSGLNTSVASGRMLNAPGALAAVPVP